MKPFSPKTAVGQRHADNNIKPEIEVFDLAVLYNGAELVKKTVGVCDRYGRRPATVAEAREILGLRPG